MTLLQLDIEQFRCIERAHLDLHPRMNLIVGANAAGKTSLLEAIFLSGTGRSFRTLHTELLVKTAAERFVVIAKIGGQYSPEVIGIGGSEQAKEIRINGEGAKSLSELAVRLPVQIIDPEVHRLLEDGPTRRRRFVDWGVFHVERRFHETWRRYQRALRQRNAALKAKHSVADLRLWDQELSEQGTLVAEFRDDYVASLKPFVQGLGQELLGLDVSIEHQRGWRRQSQLAEVLAETLLSDQRRGMTAVGPHRSDLLVKIGHEPAKDYVSRGQQKMLACVLILSQQLHRAAGGAAPACLLVDDPAAELDVGNLRKLVTALARIPAQLVMTALNRDILEFFPSSRAFHVEHGAVAVMP
jgi:DNA replication and repair protein RecF